jgi:hypothetical protein
MTLATEFSLVAGGQITNRGQTELKPIGQTVVPEPATLTLFATGLTWLCARHRRHRR